MTEKQITALALYSGGLDSTLACRVLADQDIKVVAVKFVTPFFGYELLLKQEEYIKNTKEKFGIDVILRDVTLQYLELLKKPAHGFGRYFNPCMDCKIFLLLEAKKIMPELGASFLVTGEVVGQRPMSQRRDALRIIERDSGCEGILVRPLCAKNLEPTLPERDGLIDRDKLFDFSGRNRRPQMELAEQFGITDYPSPAGGCILTDPVLSLRIQSYYDEHEKIVPADILLMMVGRQFKLPSGSWLVVGRNRQENEKLESLRQQGDWMLWPNDFPGPTVILRHKQNDEDLQLAASILLRYAKKAVFDQGKSRLFVENNGKISELEAVLLEDETYLSWQQP